MRAPGGGSRRTHALVVILLLGALAEGALLALWWFRDPDRARISSPVLRGRRLAIQMGCFGCHGSEGGAGVPNPGARFDEVPAWSGGTFMMYNRSPEEIREWISDGIPARLQDDPGDIDRRKGQLISMPAYRERLAERELDDLAAYVRAISAAVAPPEGSAEAEGRELAVRHGCLGCHGPEGRGLIMNPGSFKGYIPAWDSDDYLELVRNPEEFHEWVATGEIRRFRDNPAGAYFLDHQAIRMPSFKDVLGDDQIDRLRAYVEWVRARRPDALR